MSNDILFFLIFFIILLVILGLVYFRSKHLDRWIIPYIKSIGQNKINDAIAPIHLYVAICDHFEPFWSHVSQEIAEHRVATWCREYPKVAKDHYDCEGKHPIHTFFYAEEDYNPQFLDSIAKLCRDSFSDVEIHMHHHNDNAENFKRRIEEYRDVLFQHHNLLRKDEKGVIKYGFIHGNWALNNCRPDGRLCGIDNEIPILKETGCYADFTFPSAPDITQPSIINSIYFSPNLPGRPSSHEYGYKAALNTWSDEDLLLITGPLSLNWKIRKWGIFPKIENSEISAASRINRARINLWVNAGIRVEGHQNHIFIKLHSHGAMDSSIRYLFHEAGLSQLWNYLENNYNDTTNYKLHYISAFEMFTRIKDLCNNSGVMQSSGHATN